MRKILAFVLSMLATVAFAATASLTWTNATKNTDGSNIPATGPGSLTSTLIEYGSCSGGAFGTKAGEVVVAGTVTNTTVPGLEPGTYCFRAKHINTYGEMSDWSAVVSKTYAAPKPNPPTNFSIG